MSKINIASSLKNVHNNILKEPKEYEMVIRTPFSINSLGENEVDFTFHATPIDLLYLLTEEEISKYMKETYDK